MLADCGWPAERLPAPEFTDATEQRVSLRHFVGKPLLIANEEASLPFPRPGALPTSYLLDSEGKLKQTLVGELDQSKIEMLKATASRVSH